MLHHQGRGLVSSAMDNSMLEHSGGVPPAATPGAKGHVDCACWTTCLHLHGLCGMVVAVVVWVLVHMLAWATCLAKGLPHHIGCN